MRTRLALCAATLAGCGRLGFATQPDAQRGDARGAGDGARGQPAFVQVAQGSCGSAVVACGAVFPSSVAAGDFVVVTATYQGAMASAVSDAQSDAFSPQFTNVAWPVNPFATSIWAGPTAGSSVLSILVQFSGQVEFADVYAQEFANVSAVDQTATAQGVTGTAVAAGPVVIATAPELVFGHGEAQGAAVGPGSGFVKIDDASGNSEEYELAPTVGSYGASFDLSSSGEWIAFVLTLH